MKVRSAIKCLCKDCYAVRRGKTRYIYCKKHPKHKQRQGFHTHTQNTSMQNSFICGEVGQQIVDIVDQNILASETMQASFPTSSVMMGMQRSPATAFGGWPSVQNRGMSTLTKQFPPEIFTSARSTSAFSVSNSGGLQQIVNAQQELMQSKAKLVSSESIKSGPMSLNGGVIGGVAGSPFDSGAPVTVSPSRAALKSGLDSLGMARRGLCTVVRYLK